MVGDTVILTATFRTAAGVLADPTDFTVVSRAPDGTTTTVTDPHASIANPSTGVWTFTFVFTAAGDWYFYLLGEGGGAGAAEQVKVKVRAPKMELA